MIRVDRVEQERRAVESGTASATSLDVRDEQAHVTTPADVLDRVAGVRVRRLGGLGSLATLAIRGSTASQVLVLLDGIPLNGAAFGTADVGSIPLAALERIDVYRGDAPPGLGLSGPGGVVALWTRQPTHASARASASFGSLLSRRLVLGAGSGVDGRLGRLSLMGLASYEGSRGDFAFYDDAGTELTSADDRVRRRLDDDHDALDALVRGGWRRGPMRADLSSLLQLRDAGLPGLGAFQALHARGGLRRSATSLRWRWAARRAAVQSVDAHLDALAQQDRLDDPDAEIGSIARRVRDVSWRAGGGIGVTTDAVGPLHLRGDLAFAHERWLHLDVLRPGGEAPRQRTSGGLGLEVPVELGRLLLVPAARLDVVADAFPATATTGAVERTRLLASPRLGAGLRLADRGELRARLRAHVGSYARAPTFFELFGDRGVVVGSPALRPERGLTADVGVTVELGAPDASASGGRLDAALFALELSDVIVLVQNAQRTSIPRNLGAARILGAELAGEARLALAPATLRALVSYTLTASENREPGSAFGQRLPARPLHEIYARLEASAWLLTAGVDLDASSPAFVDELGLVRTAPRYFLGADVRLRWRAWTLALDVRNLLDRTVERVPATPHTPGGPPVIPLAVSDYGGYPLPGRTVFATLSVALDRR